jgi:hypothetical protein
MLDLSSARLTTLAVHKVGNKVRHEGVTTSKELFPLDEEGLTQILEDYFLKPFKAEEFFKFAHPTDLPMNEVYSYCREIFQQSREDFLKYSTHLLNHLYTQSAHPHIKSGELYVAHFRECVVDGQETEAVGIFKSENKDVFLKVEGKEDAVDMHAEEGINIKKLDKGCLVFNLYPEDGYSVLMVDKSSEDTTYWREDFLQVKRIQDNSFHTENFLSLTRNFCEDVFGREQDKKEQVVFLNRSLNYFNKHKEFDLDEFKEDVLPSEEYRDQFDDFRRVYEEESGLPPAEEGFAISKFAVRNQRKHFRTLIKLDTHVEIKLDPKHAETASEWIERAYDEHRGMFYYKVFFNEEMEEE